MGAGRGAPPAAAAAWLSLPHVHNRYFPLLTDVVEDVEHQFQQWERENETLHRLCAII